MSTTPVGCFEIYVQDMAKARSFYEVVFAVKLESIRDETPKLWKFPQSMTDYGASGALARMEGVLSGGHSTRIYFRCEDWANEPERVEGAGGSVRQEKVPVGEYGFVAPPWKAGRLPAASQPCV